ncbi:hypothetical protein [Streptomyces shenzhenensis]|nr:hypothetical protein [Streptomyces shenzhenensis]
MTRAQKILAVVALVLGVTAVVTSPASAENAMPSSPQDGVVVTVENPMP